MNLTLSKKQKHLLDLITQHNKYEIYVLGSVQSGKTYDICLGTILYAQELYKHDPHGYYNGAIIGWTTETLKGNIVDVLEQFLKDLNIKYILKYGNNEKYLKIYNMKFYFFSFNNYLSFNKILGKPLIFEWVDESARIYTQNQLRQSFDELPGRQVSYVGHPLKKTIHSFNVEGNENHPYKQKYLNKSNAEYLTFYPYDNPKITTENQMQEVLDMFPEGSLREQKIYCKWVVSEGLVFNKYNEIYDMNDLIIREIGIGADYGSVNQTCFIPIALAWHNKLQKWVIVRLECYYHDPKVLNTNPTTEYFSKQLRLFMLYLKRKYNNVTITDLVIDSAAAHFDNRLTADGIAHKTSIKGDGSVMEGVQYIQSLFYKDYLFMLVSNSIKHIHDNGDIEYCNKDESLIEFKSYQYDMNASIKTGYDCYLKQNEDSVDATRYILQEWRIQNKAPTV